MGGGGLLWALLAILGLYCTANGGSRVAPRLVEELFVAIWGWPSLIDGVWLVRGGLVHFEAG